jgi:hypothetical protein
MRATTKQRVICTGCQWTGGRADGPEVLDRPCFKCGQPVEKVGPSYEELRAFAGCRCGWYGTMSAARVGNACRLCGAATGVVHLVLEDGTVLR